MAWWLNGPGTRWLAPRLAADYLARAGFRMEFALDGSLLGGLVARDLSVASDGALARLAIDRVKPDYRLLELLRGKLRGLEIEGAFVDVRLDAGQSDPAAGESLDTASLVDRIGRPLDRLRERLVPMDIDLGDIAARFSRDGEVVLEIASGSLRHAAGEDGFHLRLGSMRDAAGNTWPAQDTRLTWTRGTLAVDRIDPLPGVSVRGLSLSLARENALAAEAELGVGDAVFFLNASPGLESLTMDLREGRLDSARIEEIFSVDLPLATTLTSLSLIVDKPLPDPARATGSARMLFENTLYDGWLLPGLGLDLTLEETLATIAAGGNALDTEFSIRAETTLVRGGRGIVPVATAGTIGVTDAAALVEGLGKRNAVVSLPGRLPPSSADAAFRIEWKDHGPAAGEMELTLKAAEPDEQATLFLTAGWEKDGPLRAGLRTEGAEVDAVLRNDIYQADATFRGFRSEDIGGWLAAFGIDPGGKHLLSAVWNGGGNIKDAIHRGRLDLESYRLERAGTSAISADARIVYNWPSSVTAEALRLRSAEQMVRADAKLADGWLHVEGLRWSDGERELLSGKAKLPAPAQPGAWRETLAEDTRPLAVEMASGMLPFSLLKQWFPASMVDDRATGNIKLGISGTYAMPEIDASIELRGLRRAGDSKLPVADLDLMLTARDGRLNLDGALTTPGQPAALINAAMPFRPARWAVDTALLMAEPVEASAEIPRLDLAQFADLLPGVEKLSGKASVRIDVGGSIEEPSLLGRLELSGVTVRTTKESIPPITGGTVKLEATPARITLVDLNATIAGGSLRGGGSLTLVDGKPGVFDFRLTGDALPLLRDDSMIVRANADLRLSGAHPRPALTGTIAVVDSLFYRDIELLPIGVPFTTPSAAKLPGIDPPAGPAVMLPGPFRDWPLDLRVTTGNPFLIRGNLATGEITADLRLRGTVGNPLPDGQVRINDLTAELPFSTLEVKSGALRFTPETGFDPIIDLRATAYPRPYTVSGHVYGRASDPQLVLVSSPPLPENEIMTLLATGTTTGGLENPQTASSRALQLLFEETRRGRNVIGRQLRPLLEPLGRVDFTLAEDDPYSGKSFSTATLSLTERWFLSAGMSDDGNTRLLAVWRLVFH